MQHNLESKISGHLRKLTHWLLQDAWPDACSNYRELYKIGSPAIPQIREAVLQYDWAKLRYREETRLLCGLVSLIHDIDEAESRSLVEQIIGNGCAIQIRQLLRSIVSFTVKDYLSYSICGVTILEHKGLIASQRIRPRLKRYMENVPAEDLKEIERIYIVGNNQQEYLGLYTPILNKIVLVWNKPDSRFDPLSWTEPVEFEMTLYHEIGHHAHRHPFGQNPAEEEAANEYAGRLIAQRWKRDHVFLFYLIRGLNRLRRLLGRYMEKLRT